MSTRLQRLIFRAEQRRAHEAARHRVPGETGEQRLIRQAYH
jgi:hypothetical protein